MVTLNVLQRPPPDTQSVSVRVNQISLTSIPNDETKLFSSVSLILAATRDYSTTTIFALDLHPGSIR